MSNRPHHRPDGDTAGAIPEHLSRVAGTLNAWMEAFADLRPGAVRFRAEVVDVVHAGELEAGVQLWVIQPTGTTVAVCPPDLADELAALLVEKAREARSGIVTAKRAVEQLTNGASKP